MAKKTTPKKKATPKKARKATPKSKVSGKKRVITKKGKKKVISKIRKVAPKKKNAKKVGRKPSVPNRYNAIKSAISAYYRTTIGRPVKHYELKVIYGWIVQQYGTQSIRYMLMNIDAIVDAFWNEYCNLYPVDLTNHARFFDWFYFKSYLNDEKPYHYPSDIIQVDLSEIGETEPFEFFFEDYLSKADEYYRKCMEAGIKKSSPPPSLYLEDAFCDISKKGNVYHYKLLLDSEMPLGSDSAGTPIVVPPVNPVTNPTVPLTPISTAPQTPIVPVEQKPDLTQQQLEIELARERMKKEYELKEYKLKELAKLLKDKSITFNEYLEAIKNL